MRQVFLLRQFYKNSAKAVIFVGVMLCLMTTSFVHATEFDHRHKAFSKLLLDVVTFTEHQSRVDYSQVIVKQDQLDEYLYSLKVVSREQFDAFTQDQQLAFLINTYNANQLKQVIDHYPIESIRDVGSFFSSPWSKEFFTLFGEPASLDHVEHDLIRVLFDEPRIHFAVNCASISCPPLMPEAFIAEQLDAQLEAATLNFLADSDANRLEGKTLYVSKIFDWYEEDFDEGVVEFVSRYREDWPKRSDDVRLRFTDYDWNLNVATP